MCCTNCFRPEDECELLKNAYGDWLCEDCWDEYINTDEGKVEYFINICLNGEPIEDFDADFLGEATQSFLKNASELDLEPAQILDLENRAAELGLL